MEAKAIRRTVAAALVAVGIAVTIPSAVQACSGAVIQTYSTSGSVVRVTVKNTSMSTFVGGVQVNAKVAGVAVVGSAPVMLFPGQSACVDVAFLGAVGSVTSVGISESPTPF